MKFEGIGIGRKRTGTDVCFVISLSHLCITPPLTLRAGRQCLGCPMLVLDGVSRRFGGKAAVANVSLEVEPGNFIGIIGRSGAGKSTLLRMINRLVEPTAGRII